MIDWTQVLLALIALISSWIAYKQGQMARKVEAVKAEVGTVHVLVNDAMSIQLTLNATLARRIADMTNDPRDADAAGAAEEKAADNAARAAILEKGP